MAKGHRKRATKALAEPELATARLVLPASEIRRLVWQIVSVEGVAPFVRRMVILSDGLRAGRIETLTRVARQSRSRPFAQLIAAVSRAARRGLVEEAEETVFYAASYAYRNSLDYLLGLLSYLDGFRRARADAPRPRRR